MATWFPESADPDDTGGLPDREAGQRSDPQYTSPYSQEQYPVAGESYERPTRRSQQAGVTAYDTPPVRDGRPAPAGQNQETQHLPFSLPSAADQGGYGSAAYPSGPYTPTPAPTPAPAGVHEAAPATGRRSASGGVSVPPSVRGSGSGHTDPPNADPGGDQSPAVPSESAPGRSRGEAKGRAPGQPLSRLLAALAWPVTAIGLFVPEASSSAFGRYPAWSAFALLSLVLVGVGAFGGREGPGTGRTWVLGVVGACGLAVFWVLLVLPLISRNTSFALTLGTALAAGAVWLTPGQRRV